MSMIGLLTKCVLCVKHRGKWKKRLCILEKHATFTNSLNFYVMDQDESSCQVQDVVHAYLWFLDPNHQGTLMLVCNYKVRCISFDQFEDVNKWVEILKTHLTCNYFHADLVLASKESKLHNHARRRRRQLRFCPASSTQRRNSNNYGTNGPGMFRISATSRGDGYLHVTRDRICFTTSPACSRPRLLATWSFENDELVQCGTARTRPNDTGSCLDKASLFFLTASPNHPDAPGSYLFLCDRATELCEWIERHNQSAIYQSEWRRLTAVATVLDAPYTGVVSDGGAVGSVSFFDGLSSSSTVLGNSGHINCFHSMIGDIPTGDGQVDHDLHDLSFDLAHDCSHLEGECELSDHQTSEPSDSSSSSNQSSGHEKPSLCSLDVTDATPAEIRWSARIAQRQAVEPFGSGSDVRRVPDSPQKSDVKGCFSNPVAQAEFVARKQLSMHSRRRFSSHPVDTRGHPLGVPPIGSIVAFRPLMRSAASCGSTQSTTAHGAPISCCRTGVNTWQNLISHSNPPLVFHSGHGDRWRQSEPQLVTLPPIPMSLNELWEFLRRHKCDQPTVCTQVNVDRPVLHNVDQSILCGVDSVGIAKSHVLEPTTKSPLCTRLSECSTASVSDSGSSCNPCAHTCSQCDISMDTAEVRYSNASVHTHPAFTDMDVPPMNQIAVRRKRLPSSWSTAASAFTCAADVFNPSCNPGSPQPSSSFEHRQPMTLNRSLSTGNSPQYSFTPLLPTSTIIPGSQTFFRRRQHTASASEAVSSTRGSDFSTGGQYASAVSCCCDAVQKKSSKSSLVNLSPSSMPIWAEAPAHAKPRTGGHYVSREVILALHVQKKRQQQQQQHLFHHPGGPHNHPKDGSCYAGLTGSSPPTSMSSPITHSCSPVPESLKETDDTTTSKTLESACSQVSPQCSCVPRESAASKLSNSDLFGSSPGRSYINVGPGRRIGLQPIDERQAMPSALTEPICRSNRGHVSVTTDSTDGCVCSTAFGCSYVNISEMVSCTHVTPVSSLSSSVMSSGGDVVSSSAPFMYINLPPTTVTAGSGRGLHGLPTTSSSRLRSRAHSGSTSAVPSEFEPTVTSPSLAHNLTTSETSTTNGAPRLHYAHLTLSTQPGGASATRVVPSATLSSSSSDARPQLHSVQSDQPNCSLASHTTSVNNVVSSGLNYVTIDLVQTKALSELEQELRTHSAATGFTSLQPPPSRHWGFRNNLRRDFANSSTLPGSNANEEATSRLRSTDRASSHSGAESRSAHGQNDGLDNPSLSSRVLNYLASSLNLQSSSIRKASSRRRTPAGLTSPVRGSNLFSTAAPPSSHSTSQLEVPHSSSRTLINGSLDP